MNNRLADKQIVLISDSGAIPSLYVRFADPIQLITSNYNVGASYTPGLERIALGADLLIAHRWFGSQVRAIVDDAQRRGVPIIYETDDNLLDLSEHSSMSLSDQHRADIEHVIRCADLVVCSTRALADALGPYNARIEIIENYGLPKPVVDLRGEPHLAIVNSDYFKLSDGKAALFDALEVALSNFGYRVSFFGSIDPAMEGLKQRHPDRVAIIDDFVDDRSAFLDRLYEHGINVSLVPLEHTRQHTYKSDIKFLDFASLGIPAIFNNPVVYGAVRHRVDGFLCLNSFDGWLSGLEYLSIADNRERLGLEARKVVQERRSIEHYAARFEEVCTSMLNVNSQKDGLSGSGRGEDSMLAVGSFADRVGIFWDSRNLFVLHHGRKRHILDAKIIPKILEAGLGFVELSAEERAELISGAPLVNAQQVQELTEVKTPRPARSPADGAPMRISWVVPALIIGGGGHRNIIRCAYNLEKLGHEVALYFVDTPVSGLRNAQLVREHFYPFKGHIGLLDDSAAGSDIVFATHWSTMRFAERFADRVGEIVYFVQDFEPNFYAMGSDYVLAEATYRKGYYAITSGIWCEDFLRNTFQSEADHFQFPIDRDIYFPIEKTVRQNRVIFFAKPEMPRRCYEVGAMALRYFNSLRPDVEIAFYGSSHAADLSPGFPVTQLGVLPGPKDLAHLYRTSIAGMVFSTTNPSLVPYEMMACGLPVVDLDRPGNDLNYGGRKDVARLADPDPIQIARALAQMIADSDELASRSMNGIALAATFPTEEDVGKRIERLLLHRVAHKRQAVSQ